MADDAHSPIPLSIHDVIPRLQELEVVFGVRARPHLERVRAALIEALAARDRGDGGQAAVKIAEAMERLGALADDLDPAEAAMVRALTQMFRGALQRGDQSDARRVADAMFERSGAREIKKDGEK